MTTLYTITGSSQPKNYTNFSQPEAGNTMLNPIKQSLVATSSILPFSTDLKQDNQVDCFKLNPSILAGIHAHSVSLHLPKESFLVIDLSFYTGAKKELVDFLQSAFGLGLKYIKIDTHLLQEHGFSLLEKCSNIGYHIFLDLQLNTNDRLTINTMHEVKQYAVSVLSYNLNGSRERAQETLAQHNKILPNTFATTSIDNEILKSISTQEGLYSKSYFHALANTFADLSLTSLIPPPLKLLDYKQHLPANTLILADHTQDPPLFNNFPSIPNLKEAHLIVLGPTIFNALHPLEQIRLAISSLKGI